MIPPPNIAATVTRLEKEKEERPLMPWPDVQPPAALAPTNITKPPTTALNFDTWTTSLGAGGRKVAKAALPAKMPEANVRACGGDGGAATSVCPSARQIYLPTCS